MLYEVTYLSRSTNITTTINLLAHHVPRPLATPYSVGSRGSITLILYAFHAIHRHPRNEPTLKLQPASITNIPDEDVPFHDGCVVARPGSDLHNICSTPTFTTPAPIGPFSSVAGLYPGDLYIYLLYYVRYTLADPTTPAHSRATLISNPRCTNVELPL